MSRFRTVGPSFAFTTLGNLVAELEVHLPVKAISTRPRVTRLKISNYRSVDVPARCPTTRSAGRSGTTPAYNLNAAG